MFPVWEFPYGTSFSTDAFFPQKDNKLACLLLCEPHGFHEPEAAPDAVTPDENLVAHATCFQSVLFVISDFSDTRHTHETVLLLMAR
jgi:hypothetical protein